MKKFSKCLCAVFLAILTALFYACATPTKQTYNSTKYFGTPIHIEVYSKPLTDKVITEIDGILSALDDEFSTRNPNSKLSAFNDAVKNQRVEFSQTAVEIINKATEYYTLTDGKFNFAVYPLLELWQFNSGVYPASNFVLPSETEINAVKTLCNPSLVTLADNALYKTVDGVKLDFGGIAKGYATEKIARALKDNGYTDGYINIGGSSMYVLGLYSAENEFYIRHPRKTNQTILSFSKSQTDNSAVSTSGDYERYYEQDGKRYSHIIDCAQGKPSDTGVISASIFGGDACFTDALSTALCLSSPSEITATIKKYPDLRIFVFYEKDGVKQLITNQLEGDYRLLDDSYAVVKV